MRQQLSAFISKTAIRKEFPGTLQSIMADSEEVMEYYYRGKIQELEQSLAQLTILENAREVSSLCKEIVRTKNILQKICKKKQARHSIHNSIK